MENKNIHTYKICFELGKKDFIISTKCRIKAQSSTTGACPALFKHQKLLKMQLQAQWSILEYVYPKKTRAEEYWIDVECFRDRNFCFRSP